MTDYFRSGERPFCVYTNSFDCFRRITPEEKLKRFDEANLLHTCPQGKALDLACNECSEACLIAELRSKPKPPEDFGPMYGGWPFGGF